MTADRGLHVIQDPDGQVCLICINVFRVLGKDHEFKNLSAYMEYISVDASRHHTFLTAVASYVKLHNSEPGAVRLKNAAGLRRATEVSTEVRHGSRLIKPKKVFVELPEYEKEYQHILGAPSPKDLVTELVDGVRTVGVVMLAPGEKKGPLP
jgi:hypothetical protein